MSLLPSGAIESAGYDINNSLRFRSSASAYLSRTPASAGNRKTWTWSAWVKRGALGSDYGIFSAGTNSSNAIDAFEFNSSNQIRLYSYNSAYLFQYVTTAVYRDPSAWYHIVVAVDTTQATAGNRVKLYVNGQQVTAFSTQTDPTQNSDCNFFNTASLHAIGATYNNSRFLDSYIAEQYFIDGSAKAASDFGETDATTGVWKPKPYTGTYGTNGFYLKFSDIATTSGSNAGLGKDFSGNTNYWTTNNISVTSGTTYDAMKDSPTNTSATVANYATLNPLIPSTLTYSEANLTVQRTTSNWEATGSTISVSQGKWYAEFVWTAGTYAIIGVEDMDLVSTWDNEYIGYSANGRGYGWDGNVRNNASDSAYGSTFTTSDIIGVAIDMDNKFVYMSKNGVFQNSGVPTSGATGTGGLSLAGTNYIIGAAAYNATISANFGQRPFAYTPPTGFVRLNTYNLPTPTILQGNKYMDAVTYNGSNSNLTVTNAGSFQPDLVWAKSRSGAYNNILVDAIRGGNLYLSSNTTTGDTTSSGLATFTSSGITWVGGASGVNASGDTYVDWMWKGGNGTSSNTQGSITSTVSVNTTAGFSVVTYTGNGTTGATIGHGLGVAPKMMIIKKRSAAGDNWRVYHASLGATKFLDLNQTSAAGTASSVWNDTAPTSTVWTVGTNGEVNTSTATYVCYAWAEIAGFSRFGSYTGNGSTDGPFVFTNFRPKWVMFKRTDSSTNANWMILDTSRNTYNVADSALFANLSNAELTSYPVDILSNGFKIRGTTGETNTNGGTYIYAAFAENPFKNSNAR